MPYRHWLQGLEQDLKHLDGSASHLDVTNISYVPAAYGVLSTCSYARQDDIPAAPQGSAPNIIAVEWMLDALPWTLRNPDDKEA